MSDPADMCTCGHPRSAHIYHEGACRPGYECRCTEFRDSVFGDRESWDEAKVTEPLFTIRAQDALAPLAVEAWASFAELAGKATGVAHLADQAAEARAIAQEMRAWQARNQDRVKWPD